MAGPFRAETPSGLSRAGSSAPAVASGLGILILIRLGCGPATRVELSRELKPVLRRAGDKVAMEAELAVLAARGLIGRPTGRIEASEHGAAAAKLALNGPVAAPWPLVRDGVLPVAAVGGDVSDLRLAKAVLQPDALRALIVQSAFGLPVDKVLSLGKLRTMLALRALERAFGNQIKAGLGSGGGLAAKPSRLLAAQLLRAPATFSSDGRLIAALAAEHLGAPGGEAETLRAALIGRFVETFDRQASRPHGGPPSERKATHGAAGANGVVATAPSTSTVAAAAPTPQPLRPANDRGAASEVKPAVANRPDLPGFVSAVKQAAARRAQGWPGNLKAFICHVFEELQAVQAHWSLSEIEFKGMLAEAHRTGGLVLANADLKDKRFIQEFEKSAIQYKNTVWHFVRVEEG